MWVHVSSSRLRWNRRRPRRECSDHGGGSRCHRYRSATRRSIRDRKRKKEQGTCHLQKAPGLPGSAPTVSNGFATTAVDSGMPNAAAAHDPGPVRRDRRRRRTRRALLTGVSRSLGDSESVHSRSGVGMRLAGAQMGYRPAYRLQPTLDVEFGDGHAGSASQALAARVDALALASNRSDPSWPRWDRHDQRTDRETRGPGRGSGVDRAVRAGAARDG
jgi:hypothetical protein